MMIIPTWIGLGICVLSSSIVKAGYLSVNMTTATQCGTSLVQWSGDSGPYHLLLTPTEFKQHGYNVWIESIPDGTNDYDLPIRLPEGLQYMLTVWGSSGIRYAATTDVLTVQASPNQNSSCFLSDDAILNLYTFSFNLTSNSGDYPPQCSNISLTWPSSLESNVTSDYVSANQTTTQALSPRSTAFDADFVNSELDRNIESNLNVKTDLDLDLALEFLQERDASSSEHNGNTTHPPTMFGIIPLGNSFSIPITYNTKSKYAKYLPDSSLSDNPTTYTSQGVTHLNWTVDLAKGTRFILVAGIGSQEEWASGGSSSMFTVGQGSSGCIGSEQSGNSGAPSVTASSSAPTGTSDQDNSPPPSGSNNTIRTVVASVLSVIATLVLVGLIFLCRRARNRRRSRSELAGGGLHKRNNGKAIASDQLTVNSETPLDLIESRNDGTVSNPPRLSPLVLDSNNAGTHSSTTAVSPMELFNPFADNLSPAISPSPSKQPFLPGPSRGTTVDDSTTGTGTGTGTWSSTPTSPIRGNPMTRNSSQDALLPITGFSDHYRSSSTPPPLPLNFRDAHTSRAGPLQLHDRRSRNFDPMSEEGDGFEEDGGEESEMTDLKRDTIAYLGGNTGNQTNSSSRRRGGGGGGGRGGSSIASAPSGNTNTNTGRRRRYQESEPEYVIHRDGGRVIHPQQEEENSNILELPPRYEEVNWEQTREREDMEERERQTR
ncbi:uncharacterized protein IL334_007527 [Kwoniella shivajii]|uniref:Uncharacterized protein n=1 Tax=Kwoniella shivajii TaxID=564305 RepID=A0ABZ1DAR8_9TREE|nr:hypothetical protein IL334_007527 [Kwoniella shivajii]